MVRFHWWLWLLVVPVRTVGYVVVLCMASQRVDALLAVVLWALWAQQELLLGALAAQARELARTQARIDER